MCKILELAELCRNKTVYIQTHNFPDPDAIASAYGLQMLLKSMDIPSRLCYAGCIDKLTSKRMLETFGITMYAYDQLREEMKETDSIICVDSQKNAGNITDFVGDEVACIDHHPIFVEPNYQYTDIRMLGACSSIIAEYFSCLGIEPDKNTATALLYGIKMDTMQFSRGVTLQDIHMFAFLFPFCDQNQLAYLEHNTIEFADLKAYGAAIDSIKIYEKVGICFIPFSCPDGLIGSVSDFILSLEEVEVSIVSSVRPDGMKFSIRSETERVHAGSLIHTALQEFGDGGGHASMAGGLIPRENLPLLEPLSEHKIQILFLEALASLSD